MHVCRVSQTRKARRVRSTGQTHAHRHGFAVLCPVEACIVLSRPQASYSNALDGPVSTAHAMQVPPTPLARPGAGTIPAARP